jgi:hypothetical protein
MKKSAIAIIIVMLICSSINGQNRKEDDFFVFEPDIRLFTSYAFMNVAGYDHDWNPTMHHIRIEVRQYLDSILPGTYKKEIHQYYDKFGGGDFYDYGVYAINSNFPPDFGLICDTCKMEGLDKFVNYDSLLRDFYKKAEIEKLWKKYYKELYAINMQYKPFAEIAIKQITSYCRTDSNYFRNHANGKFYFQQIPLMSHFTAFFNESGNNYWVISGPSNGEPDPSAFYHEPLHKIINPIVESNEKINKKLESMVSLSQQRLKGDYNDITNLLCESFVRTIDRILYARHNNISKNELHQIIENEYKLGHIFTFYLLDKLTDYEASNKSLQEYYPQIISNLDLKVETERWNNYWKNHKDE